MRILQATSDFSIGGAERVMANLTRHLVRHGHSVGAVSLYEPRNSPIERELGAEGAELFFLGKRRRIDPRMIPRLARVFSTFHPDVIHTHGYVLRYILPALARRPCPVVHTIHSLAQHEVDLPGRAIQFVAFRAGVTAVAIGEAVAESFRVVYRLEPHRTIPNGIPVAAYLPSPGDREAIRTSLGISPVAPVIATVGRLTAAKNHELLIAAFASDRLRNLGAHLLIAGEGSLRPALEEQARALHVCDRTHFLGMRDDIARVLAAADVFALTSRWEGNPLTVMEAMAAGKPVIATRVGCVPELVLDGTGEVVAPGDEDALDDALVRLASDPARASTQGAAAAALARERFDESLMAREYEALYRELA